MHIANRLYTAYACMYKEKIVVKSVKIFITVPAALLNIDERMKSKQAPLL